MKPITHHHLKLIDAAEAIRLDPDQTEAAFMARQLVQATLPHKNPGDVPLWKRTNGNLTLGIQPGMNVITGKSYGYPYGTIPRLLLFWITTEAVKTKNRRLELGNSLSFFMRQLGLSTATGRGKRGDAKRLRDQMERLFRARISFDQSTPGKKAWVNMQVAPEGVLWWDEKQPDQTTLWESWIQLGEKFFEGYCQINRFQGDHRDTEGESPAGVLLCSRLCSRDLPPDVPSVGHLLAILSGAKAVTSGTEV